MRATFPTASDVRTHALVLGVCLWSAFAINIATAGLIDRTGQIKGTDFAQFYVAGWMSLNGYAYALNDPSVFADVAIRLLPALNGTYYLPVYGPQVALFFAPLATLPYAWALTIWLVMVAIIYGVCCWLVWRTCPNLEQHGTILFIVAAASPAFVNVVAHGQNSVLALACFTGAYLALQRNKPFVAGLAIGSLAFKPQLGIVFAVVFLLHRDWRVVAGAIVAAAAQIFVAWAAFGTATMYGYWRWLGHVGQLTDLLWVKPYQMHSLSAWWSLLLPWRAVATTLYVLCATVTVVCACWIWGLRTPLSLRFSFLLLATVLVSPHLYVYDLVVLVPALLLTTDWAFGHSDDPLTKPMQRALYFSYVLPIVGVVAQFTRMQVSVVAMTALSVMLLQWAKRYSKDLALSSAPRV